MENASTNSQGSLEQQGTGRSLRVLTGCLLALLVLSTLMGNALVCLAVTRFHHLRAKVTNCSTGTRSRNGGAPGLQPAHCDARLNRTYALTSSLISFYIPVAIMIGTYTRIYRIAQAQIRRISSLERAGGLCSAQGKEPTSFLRSSLRKETKVLQTLSLIMGIFVCCWLPFFLLNCLLPFCELRSDSRGPGQPQCISQTTFNIFMWFGWANSSLNPVIYAFNADFRQAFSSLLSCHHLPCWAANSSAVERVDLSNDLISYPQDSSCCLKEGGVPIQVPPPVIAAWSPSLSHAGVSCQEDKESHGEPQFEKGRLPSCQVAHRSNPRNFNLPHSIPLETEISLDTITPFTGITAP
ncbi:hypothetical protein lerEdw1_007729 [Lerista edwardsae]|nr:hypothetical protein lerEdw1_007729 [Lerista edwardsae]